MGGAAGIGDYCSVLQTDAYAVYDSCRRDHPSLTPALCRIEAILGDANAGLTGHPPACGPSAASWSLIALHAKLTEFAEQRDALPKSSPGSAIRRALKEFLLLPVEGLARIDHRGEAGPPHFGTCPGLYETRV